MKVIVQRVTKASVTVGDELINSIGQGFCLLVGICKDDTKQDCEFLARKVLSLRLFDDDSGKRWCKNVADKRAEILCVSQFTLCGVVKKNKPDFRRAMGGEPSRSLYDDFLKELGKMYDPGKVKDGVFGAYMQVRIQNDGPVTIEIESPPKGDDERAPNDDST